MPKKPVKKPKKKKKAAKKVVVEKEDDDEKKDDEEKDDDFTNINIEAPDTIAENKAEDFERPSQKIGGEAFKLATTKEEKIQEIEKDIDKKKKAIEVIASKGEALIQKQKEIYQIKDQITKRVDHSDALVSWIMEFKKKLFTASREERIEGWEKIAEAVGTLVDHSTQISELAAKGNKLPPEDINHLTVLFVAK